MVTQCCVCKKYRAGTRWGHMADTQQLKNGVSHGYCPDCAEKAFEEVRQVNAAKVQALVKATASL